MTPGSPWAKEESLPVSLPAPLHQEISESGHNNYGGI